MAIEQDEHENDMVMPGFRFHPTEEELLEFYLRRKVEGKRFNVDLITFLDLYRYDPWELPVLAGIGEKEWYFYVPRDRKYRNGDRPNRVTTSGYWKATGADRTVRSENSRPIGLKKTLVFYSGKAPKGLRTSWIMNEYRLPHHDTHRLHNKVEISLCRVHKRAGIENHRSLPTNATSSSSSRGSHSIRNETTSTNHVFRSNYGEQMQQIFNRKLDETSTSSSTSDIGTSLGHAHLNSNNNYSISHPLVPIIPNSTTNCNTDNTTSNGLSPNCPSILPSRPSPVNAIDELQKVVNNYNLRPQPVAAMVVSGTLSAAAVAEGVWDWGAFSSNSSFSQ